MSIRLYNRGMSQPLHLYRLQQVDSQLDSAHKRLEEIKIALEDDSALKQAEMEDNSALAEQETAQRELKRAEEEVAAQQQKIANNQKTLYNGSVTNSKELEDLQNEAAALGRYLNTLEEKQIEKMIALEEVQAIFSQTQENLENVKTKGIQDNALLNGERSILLDNIDKFKNDREKALEIVDADNLRLYTKLRKKKRGRAVAEVKDSICAACGSTLTAAQAQEARSPTIITCCNRYTSANSGESTCQTRYHFQPSTRPITFHCP